MIRKNLHRLLFCLVLLISAPASASVLSEAANHLTVVGVPTSVPEVAVENCLHPPGWDGMCAYRDGRLTIASFTMTAVDITEKAFNERTLRGCVGQCELVMFLYLHELVHLDRFAVQPQEQWDPVWEEGLADAIAYDQLAPFAWRLARLRVMQVTGGYAREMTIVRWRSSQAVHGPWWGRAARRWRLNQVSLLR